MPPADFALVNMKPMNAWTVACLLLLTACKKEDGSNPTPPAPPPPPAVNRAPVADAGVDMTGMTGETFSLSAAASTDPDADTLTYSWVIASGPAGGTLTNATQARGQFSGHGRRHLRPGSDSARSREHEFGR